MFLQFLDLYGNPVYVRPERVDALRGIATTWEGTSRAATLIVMTNRETFRLRGHVDTIKDGIDAWHRGRAPKAMTATATFEGCPEVTDRRHRASANPQHATVDAVATMNIDGSITGRSFKVSPLPADVDKAH